MADILARREGDPDFQKPDPDAILIHLRLGDKVEYGVYTPLRHCRRTELQKAKHGVKSLFSTLLNNFHYPPNKSINPLTWTFDHFECRIGTACSVLGAIIHGNLGPVRIAHPRTVCHVGRCMLLRQ